MQIISKQIQLKSILNIAMCVFPNFIPIFSLFFTYLNFLCSPEIASLLKCLPAVTFSLSSQWQKHKNTTIHSNHTSGLPLSGCSRCFSSSQLTVVKSTFEELERLGIIQRSSSQWSARLHRVPKPNSSWRPCGDYCCLNTSTISDKYPLSNLHDLSANMHGATIFLKLDLEKGYYQPPKAPADIPKMAIISPLASSNPVSCLLA